MASVSPPVWISSRHLYNVSVGSTAAVSPSPPASVFVSNSSGVSGSFVVVSDLFAAVRGGTSSDLSAALASWRQRAGASGAIDSVRSPQGVTLLHVAVWRNRLRAVEQLLDAGAEPDVQVRWRVR